MDRGSRAFNAACNGLWTVLVVGLVASAFLVGPLAATAGEIESSIARGGKLYDKWYKVIDAETPKGTHPAYTAEGKKKGSSTWRCKECHGWDYMGKDGAYAKGSHFTGIVGIRGMAGADPATIVAVLKDDTHGLAGKMDDQDFQDLALFVSKGQVDMDQYIDRASKAPKGDKAKGAAYFNTICANCHGFEGTKVKDMSPMGKVVSGNPWESLHKILNGQPGEEMPALRALDIQISVDALAYAQTLPKEK